MVNCEEVRKSVTDDAEEKYGELVTTLESVASYVSDAESEMSYIDDTLDINESDVEVRIDDLQILIDKLQYSINTNEEDKDDTTN
jgi:DNA repair ATPase RecN